MVTKRKPTDAEMRAMRFGWKVVRHVKSNAIVYAGEDRTLATVAELEEERAAAVKAVGLAT